MTYRGRVKNGVIVLERAKALPEGAEVSIRPLKTEQKPAKAAKRPNGARKGLLKLAGKAKDLPADAARNLDHYLYGHPKR
jgi:hypothetical protein